MKIMDILVRDAVILDVTSDSKSAVLEEMARSLADAVSSVEPDRLLEVLREREALQSTGIGEGVAIPHGKLADLDCLHGVFARLERAIDFDAIDEQPVDLIFLLLAPESAGADHLKALAGVSRMLRDKAFCEKLRETDNAEALYALLANSASSRAA